MASLQTFPSFCAIHGDIHLVSEASEDGSLGLSYGDTVINDQNAGAFVRIRHFSTGREHALSDRSPCGSKNVFHVHDENRLTIFAKGGR